jgi:hypothetical protein
MVWTCRLDKKHIRIHGWVKNSANCGFKGSESDDGDGQICVSINNVSEVCLHSAIRVRLRHTVDYIWPNLWFCYPTRVLTYLRMTKVAGDCWCIARNQAIMTFSIHRPWQQSTLPALSIDVVNLSDRSPWQPATGQQHP